MGSCCFTSMGDQKSDTMKQQGLGTLVKLSKNDGFLENIAFGAGKTIRK